MPSNSASARLRTLVVDDEPLARRNLTVLLRRDPDIAAVDECSSGAEATKVIRASRPDLVFLDVQMPECDGFDVLELLGDDQPPGVVFVTAHDDYALRAFEAGALDYLLKPFTDARFQRALERAKLRVVHHREGRPRAPEPLIIKSAGQVVSSILPISTGSRLRTTTPACMLGPGRMCCVAAWRSWNASCSRIVLSHPSFDHREHRSDPRPGAHGRRRIRRGSEKWRPLAPEPGFSQIVATSPRVTPHLATRGFQGL